MAELRRMLLVLLGVGILGWSWAQGAVTFHASEIEGAGAELVFCDLAGRGLKDAVLVDRKRLLIFQQAAPQGFTQRPQIECPLGERPGVVWPARLGSEAESLLVLTSEGMMELRFDNKPGAPTRRQILQRQTLIPDQLPDTALRCFPFVARTGTDWPLLLVPVAGGLEVWQHREVWRPEQFIKPAVETHLQASVANPGYTRSFAMSLSLADVNGRGRDSLMVMRKLGDGRQLYTLYLQEEDGRFGLEPALVYTNNANWRTALSWVDLNRDGRLDLIKGTISDEPSFVPGLQSGKVLVAVYLADERGRIPAEPQQVFRKNDWTSSLPLVDIDGDGYLDAALGHIPIDSREGVRNMMTAGQINLNLKFHFHRPGAGLASAPDFQREVPIYFQQDFSWTPDHRLYYERFISLSGDFNGDGKKDLLVRESSKVVSVYDFISREKGFSAKADLRFSCPESIDWWKIQDLNGDGMSDLVVKLQHRNLFRIFISQRE